jgi:hypothetical protein
VLAIVVKFPWARCPWSLPILAAFYRPERLDAAEGRRHKTPAQLARQLFATLIHWFPEQTFTLLGDGGYATTDLAHFCARHGRHLVSRIRDDAGLYASPPARRRGAKGPPRRLAAASRDGVVREKGPDVQRRQRHDPSAVVARNDFRNLAV